jgi:Zn-finger nucleic acid-binding protein
MGEVMDIDKKYEPSTNSMSYDGYDTQVKEVVRGEDVVLSSIHFACPKCNTDLTAFFKKQLSITTGISEEILENGGLETLPTIVSAGKLILEVSGFRFDSGELAKISNRMALETVERLQRIDLEEKAKKEYERKLKESNDEINRRDEKLRDIENRYEKLETEYEELKTKVSSSPVLKGAFAQAVLLEDLEASFPEQHFKDITKEGYGDILWSNILVNVGKWIESDVGAVIDSKDKGSITGTDIEKLRRDMKFGKKEIGLIIAAKQEQLRMKETPCGIYRSEEGYILVTSRENLNHHIAMRFVRDVLARLLYEMRINKEEKAIDVGKLSSILNDIEKSKEYHKKIKSKAQGIINDIDLEEDYLKIKFQEAWRILGLEPISDISYEQVKLCQ